MELKVLRALHPPVRRQTSLTLTMNPSARLELLNRFCARAGVEIGVVSSGTQCLIAHLEAPFELLTECKASGNVKSPSPLLDGILDAMIDRIRDTLTSALTLVVLGQFSSAEVLARTVTESSVNVTYLMRASTPERLINYFNAYIHNEREQNRKWLNSLSSVPTSIRDEHGERIRAKESTLRSLEGQVARLAQVIGASSLTSNKHPKLLDIFSEIGKLLDYRTVYAALCSQAHHDAEDILNQVLAGCTSQEHLIDLVADDQDRFSLYLLICSAIYCIQALVCYATRLGLNSVKIQCERSIEELHNKAMELSTCTVLPQEFVPSRN